MSGEVKLGEADYTQNYFLAIMKKPGIYID